MLLGRCEAEEAAATTGPTDFSRPRAGGDGAREQVVDGGCGDARRETLAIVPLIGQRLTGGGPVAALQRAAHRAGNVRDAIKCRHDLRIAVDVTLHHVPVVDAGIARGARVGEHDARSQCLRIYLHLHAAHTSDRQLNRGDAAVERRAVVLHARRHVDHLGLDVLRQLQLFIVTHRPTGEGGEGRDHGDVERGGSRDTGADRRVGPRRDGEPAGIEVFDQAGEQRQRTDAEGVRRIGLDALARVFRHDDNAPIRAGVDGAVRAKADGGVDGDGRLMEEVEGPDVNGAAGKIDARRRRGVDAHPQIIMAPMSLRDVRRTVGQLAILGFAGHSVPPELRSIAKEFDLGGVIYFARNIAGPEQVRELSRECRALAQDVPLWISVDQEGGRVARLRRPFTEWPPMHTLGRCGDDQLTVTFAKALADELRAVGINLDYTPVLDVHTNPKNPVIGDRALSDRPADVARLGALMVRTLQAAGVAGCGKHFPGHGDTSTDSHYELPIVDQSPERLQAVELAPFRAAVDADVACIMTAHVLVPVLDATRPATLSPIIVDGLLKKTMGYRGVVISDDLGMKAISASTGLGEAMVLSLLAGCDAVLLCNEPLDAQVGALEAVIKAVESGRLPIERIEDALARQVRVKHQYLGERAGATEVPLARVGCEAHQLLSASMAKWA